MTDTNKKIIAQTESVRIIRVQPVPSMENAHKAAPIIVETRMRDTMGELYWQLAGELSTTTTSGSSLGAAVQTFFNEITTGKTGRSTPTAPMVERGAYTPPSRDVLGMILTELSTMVAVVEPGAVLSSFPFDNRDNAVGISIDPGLMVKLSRIYPKLGAYGILIEVLKCAARELANG